MNIAILLAGGKGTRMLRPMPKQFININGKPLIIHTLEALICNRKIDEVLIICLQDYISLMKTMCHDFHLSKIKAIIPGGENRFQSILCGLNWLEDNGYSLDTTKVLIHNANMPLISQKNLDDCIDKCTCKDCITSSVSVNTGFFYRRVGESLLLGPDRKEMLSVKVPEVVFLSLALRIYSSPKYLDEKYSSFTTGMFGVLEGKKVIPIYCESTNIKVTTEEDYQLVEVFLQNKAKIV
jgi:D-ribitol-5-phosphate cytidylyltransferase